MRGQQLSRSLSSSLLLWADYFCFCVFRFSLRGFVCHADIFVVVVVAVWVIVAAAAALFLLRRCRCLCACVGYLKFPHVAHHAQHSISVWVSVAVCVSVSVSVAVCVSFSFGFSFGFSSSWACVGIGSNFLLLLLYLFTSVTSRRSVAYSQRSSQLDKVFWLVIHHIRVNAVLTVIHN